MNIDRSPVTLDEFKKHLRLYSDEMDTSLILLLLAAVEDIQNYTLINFDEDYTSPSDVPFPLKAAILLGASRLFKNPSDTPDRLPTVSKNLAASYRRWDRIKSTQETL